MTPEEIAGAYDPEAGEVIIKSFDDMPAADVPGVLVHSHGLFSWGKNPAEMVNNAVVLEKIAMMAVYTERPGNTVPMQQELLDKHFLRKHDKKAYYGEGESVM